MAERLTLWARVGQYAAVTAVGVFVAYSLAFPPADPARAGALLRWALLALLVVLAVALSRVSRSARAASLVVSLAELKVRMRQIEWTRDLRDNLLLVRHELDLPDGDVLRFVFRNSWGNDSRTNTRTLAFGDHELTLEDHDCDHCERLGVFFDREDVVFRSYSDVYDERADEAPGSEAARAWASRLLELVGLPAGRASFERLCALAFPTEDAERLARVFD